MSTMTRRSFTQLTTAAALSSSKWMSAAAAAIEPKVNSQLTVDLSGKAVPINRMIYGQFLEHFHRQVYGGVFDPGSPLADRRGFRLDVIEALRELRVPIVRWPGGCFVSAYHWRDGVGKDRKPSFNKAWGVEDPNTFGTDEFIHWCRLIGAEPYICTNAGTGTEEEMSDWVEYCNLKDQGLNAKMRVENGSPEPFNVRYWSIGNENYLGGEIGAKTVEEWAPLVRESAKMMRAVDSRIKILAAATVNGNWTPPMLQAAGKYLDYISIHGYWDPLWQHGTHPADYLKCMSHCEAPEKQIKQAADLLDQNGVGDRVRIAFDEWNLRGWHHPGFPGGGGDRLDLIRERDDNDLNGTYTMADAVFSASFLNSCLRNATHVQMACMAPVVNVRGPLYVHAKGIVKRTTFHVLKMYSDLLEDNVLDGSTISDPLDTGSGVVPAVDAVTTSSSDKKRFALALINRDPERTAHWQLNLRGLDPRTEIRITVLSGKSTDSFNDTDHPNEVVPENVSHQTASGPLLSPPHSVSVVQFSV